MHFLVDKVCFDDFNCRVKKFNPTHSHLLCVLYGGCTKTLGTTYLHSNYVLSNEVEMFYVKKFNGIDGCMPNYRS